MLNDVTNIHKYHRKNWKCFLVITNIHTHEGINGVSLQFFAACGFSLPLWSCLSAEVRKPCHMLNMPSSNVDHCKSKQVSNPMAYCIKQHLVIGLQQVVPLDKLPTLCFNLLLNVTSLFLQCAHSIIFHIQLLNSSTRTHQFHQDHK